MLSSPWSLGFVIATILGAMLVPGCRPNMVDSALPQETRLLQLSPGPVLGPPVSVTDRHESRPGVPEPAGSADRSRL